MAMALNSNSFHPIEYIKKLRNLGVAQELAEAQAEELEHVVEIAVKLSKAEFEKKELATKSDLKEAMKELELKIEKVRYDALKFTIWTGVAVVVSLGTMLGRGFHWW